MTQERYDEIYNDIDIAIEETGSDEKIDEIMEQYLDIDEEEMEAFMKMGGKENK